MDELDKKLFKDLSEKTVIPSKCEYVIKNAFNNNRRKNKSPIRNILLIALKASGIVILTSGVVFASSKVYEKIWKKPEKVENYFNENSDWYSKNVDTTNRNIITKDMAITKFYDILNKFGYKNEIIQSIDLIDNPSDNGLFYRAITKNNFILDLDAINTDNFKIFTDIVYKDIDSYRGTQIEVENVVENICKKYGYDLSKYNHKVVSYNISNEVYNENIYENKPEYANIWEVKYNKEYNGIINKYEEITIGIIPEINELYYFIYTNRPPENTEIVISEQDAKEIALLEENKLGIKHDIKNIIAEQDIVKMNGYAYFRENDYEQYYKARSTPSYPLEELQYYRVEDRVRRVWKIRLEFQTSSDLEYQEHNFTYFVDTTTGEIIGGE